MRQLFVEFLKGQGSPTDGSHQTVVQTLRLFLAWGSLNLVLDGIAKNKMMGDDGNRSGMVPTHCISPEILIPPGDAFAPWTHTSDLIPTERKSDPDGRGILLQFALSIILKEIDKEADALMDNESPFRGARNWTWDSLSKLSLDSQQMHAMKKAPILWSVLATVTVGKGRRAAMEIKEEGRDPWQVSAIDTLLRFVLKAP